ncbi:hypothetical protein SARI_03871 [Salmonella enterica subsp. arizonae serovar 62:z4,z23:-]|uniref:Uncharacterized protein n=1 Tax=Salmonella arizonae (strain ATCC BAA-731 / CDC346-86 / RSK2980) TaxID=41514 RepID=A9MKJ6_SALAR|nr:hypothetical protein SARI_03871 [Salmonella enterica subsp. arizonae serovar 62:z4,z23:-]
MRFTWQTPLLFSGVCQCALSYPDSQQNQYNGYQEDLKKDFVQPSFLHGITSL